jgi:hypothetical protein
MASTLAPETTQTYTDLMLELLLTLQRGYRKGGVLADQYQRGNLEDHQYEENTARITIIRNVKQGTGIATESGVLPVARKIRTMKANVGIASLEHTVSLSKRLPKVTGNPKTSFAQAAELEMSMAQEAMIKTRNELLNGDGTGKIASVSGSQAASAATSQVIPVANENVALLYRGRIGDVLVKATGAVVKAGVMISDFSEATGAETITVVDAADDTVNCSFAVDNTMGFYVENAAQGAANILQGYGAAIAATGTFQGLDRNVYKDWVATDGRAGVTAAADLGVSIMDGLVRRRGSHLTPGQSFKSLWMTDPAVLDKFSQSLLTQARWQGDKGTLDTGYEYLNYRTERLFADYDAPLAQIVCIPLEDVTILEIGSGPSFDDQDGSIWKRFARTQPVEAWLIAEEQAAYTRVDRFVYGKNLNRAA